MSDRRVLAGPLVGALLGAAVHAGLFAGEPRIDAKESAVAAD